MQKVVTVLFLLLAVLFLATIGNGIVGYAIYDPQYTDLSHYPYPFIKNSGYNSLFIVVPENPTLTEIEAANNIAKSLQLTKPLPPQIIKPSQLKSKANLILIGDACTNELISTFLKTNSCTLNLKPNQGLLKLLPGKTSVLIVSGYDLENLGKAANVLAHYGSFPLKENQVIIEGTSDNIYSLGLIYR